MAGATTLLLVLSAVWLADVSRRLPSLRRRVQERPPA